jgi:hypothetical protein
MQNLVYLVRLVILAHDQSKTLELAPTTSYRILHLCFNC